MKSGSGLGRSFRNAALVLLALYATARLVQRFVSAPWQERLDALSLSFDERMDRAMAAGERQFGMQAGQEAELWRALRDKLPNDAVCFLVGQESPRQILSYSHLVVLLAPRRIYPLAALPPDWQGKAEDYGSRLFLIAIEASRAIDLSKSCDQIAEGALFRVWRFRPKD